MRSLVDEVPFDIPDSWEWVRLGSISSYAETKQKVNATSADPSIWGLDLEDIEKGGRLLEHKTVGERRAVGDKTVFAKGDILYSKLRPYLLKVLVAPDDGICTPEIVPFRVYGGIDPNYIVNYLKSPYVDNLINSITYGVKMPRVGAETMTSLLVPIPPLEEQRRIVEKIDGVASAISAYDVAYQKTETLNSAFPEALKKSILQEAVQGKLVPQDPSDEPAEALLERIRAEKQRLIKEGKIKKDKYESVIFRRDNSHYEKLDGVERCIDDELPFEIPENWCWAQLGSISSYAETKQKINAANADSDIWGLDLEDIEKGGRLIVRKTVGERKAIGDKTVFSKGDILYSKLRPYLLKILVAPECGICTPEIVPFQMYGGIVSEYIVNFLRSPYVDNLINSITYGVKMPRVGIETMTTLFVPVPPLAEQHRIVQQIEELFPLVKAL